MKWTQEQRESAIWDAGRMAKQIGAVDAAIDLACQRNELLEALKKIESNISFWRHDGCRPDEWILQEWMDIANRAIAKAGGK